MYIPLWTILPFAARHNAASLAERSVATDICLPGQLQAAVPSCAYQCLQTFIANNYNILSCSSTADINYLCTNPTVSGLTIGEASLQCVISTCIGADLQTQSGYTVCDNIPGALPEMAGTITATIIATSTFFPTSETSIALTTHASATPIISDVDSSTSSDEVPKTSVVEPSAPSATFASSTPSITSSSSLSENAFGSISGVTSIEATGSSLSAQSTTMQTSASSSTSSNASAVTNTFASSGIVSKTATNSATAAAATENAVQTGLSTSAIAGIATGVALVVALILGFLAYWFCVKRKENKRRSQRFSAGFILPSPNHPAGPVVVPQASSVGLYNNPMRRFYSKDSVQENRRSFWRRSAVPPYGIGVALAASTRVSPERRIDANLSNQRDMPSSPILAMQIDRARSTTNRAPYDRHNSFEEDIEAQGQAQNQDLPALASPKTRASSRSTSFAGVERPAPLQLHKERPAPLLIGNRVQRSNAPAGGNIPLTPVYDNGNFEPTIRQVVEDPSQSVSLVRSSREKQTPNFSRREPSLTRTTEEDVRNVDPVTRPPKQFGRFPIKPIVAPRKQSDITDRSTSVYTEFEEDSTPEEEDDKKLAPPKQLENPARVALRDIQYPQIPRPAATRKQAVATHSPRAMTIRRIDQTLDPTALRGSQKLPNREQQIPRVLDPPQTKNSSTSTLASQSSESPIFPTPPPRNPARLTQPRPYPSSQQQREQTLQLQIADAYRAASRPLTSSTLGSASHGRRTTEFPPSAYPGANILTGGPYDSPSLQRLNGARDRGTGRPFAQRMQERGYQSRPPTRYEPPRGIVNPGDMVRGRPMGPRDQDPYFRATRQVR